MSRFAKALESLAVEAGVEAPKLGVSDIATLSIAISMKRIADEICRPQLSIVAEAQEGKPDPIRIKLIELAERDTDTKERIVELLASIVDVSFDAPAIRTRESR